MRKNTLNEMVHSEHSGSSFLSSLVYIFKYAISGFYFWYLRGWVVMKKVLVTGGGGFLGSHLCGKLLDQNSR